MDSPKIISVRSMDETVLLVEFEGGRWRRYDVAPLLARPAFAALKDRTLFHSVHVDIGGYGVIWNDEVDLAEHELWVNGVAMDAPQSGQGLLWAAETDHDQ